MPTDGTPENNFTRAFAPQEPPRGIDVQPVRVPTSRRSRVLTRVGLAAAIAAGGYAAGSLMHPETPPPPIEQRVKQPEERVRDMLGVRIADLTSERDGENAQYIGDLLNAYPTSFRAELDGKILNIVITDDVYAFDQNSEGTVVIPNSYLDARNWVGKSPAADLLEGVLAVRHDSLNDLEPSSNVLDILGGDGYWDTPGKVVQKLENSYYDQAAMLRENILPPIAVIQQELYSPFFRLFTTGQVNFEDVAGQVIGEKRAEKMYSELTRDIGVQYTGDFNNGIPVQKPPSDK